MDSTQNTQTLDRSVMKRCWVYSQSQQKNVFPERKIDFMAYVLSLAALI